MDSAPSEFRCPISMEVMSDPVLCADSQTYDRKSIQQWLQSSQTSPITRQPLYANQMYPNYALKASIQRWKEEQARPPQAAPSPFAPLLSYKILPQYQQQSPFYTVPARVPAKTPSTSFAPTAPTLIYDSPEAQIQHQTRTIKLILICCSLIIFFVVVSLIISLNTRSDD